MKTLIMTVNCLVLVVIPLYFIGCRVYRDGFFGRVSLATIAFIAGACLIEIYHGVYLEFLWLTVGLVTSFVVFLSWHLFRFHHRVIMRKKLPNGMIDRRFTPQ